MRAPAPAPVFARGVVVSPSSTGNSLGRSLVVAQVAARLCGELELVAIDDGPLWKPAVKAPLTVGVGDAAFVRARLDAATVGPDPSLIVAVKPEATSASLVRRWLTRAEQRPVLWFDEDDHDIAIAEYWTDQAPPRQQITSQLTNANAPWRMRRRMQWWKAHASVITTSSPALGAELGLPVSRTAVLPHVREPVAYARPVAARELRIGFLGTPLAYKGLAELVHLLKVLPEAVLHVFDGALPAFESAGIPSERLRAHDGARADAVRHAMREVDLVALPQDVRESAARFQLPAKLLDALQHGRPALVTSTPVTEGFTHPGVVHVRDWFDNDAIVDVVRALGNAEQRARTGEALAAWCAAEFSVSEGAARVKAVLRSPA